MTSYDGPTYANQDAYAIATYYNNQPAVTYPTTISDPKPKAYDVKIGRTRGGLSHCSTTGWVWMPPTRTVNGPHLSFAGLFFYRLSIRNQNAINIAENGLGDHPERDSGEDA